MSVDTMNLADLKTELLCYGVRLPEELRTGRKGGAGPAGGRYMRVKNVLANVPVYGFALQSPFSVMKEDDTYVMVDRDNNSYEVKIIENPLFYQLKTKEGISYRKIALLHGVDCLATTVYQQCIRWRRNPCLFCGIELSLRSGATIKRKTPEQLTEVAEAAKKEGASHVTLTTGTPAETDKGAFILAECASALKSTGLPVHVQLEPVPRECIELLKDSGADTIGIHIETLDENVFNRMCPGKDFSLFKNAWKDAVDIFGENQVSSYILVGLGEDPHRMVAGIKKMVQTGVIPYVVPFRPIAGTALQERLPPLSDPVKNYAVCAAQSMKDCGVNPFRNRAGCVRCGACSPVKDYLRTL